MKFSEVVQKLEQVLREVAPHLSEGEQSAFMRLITAKAELNEAVATSGAGCSRDDPEFSQMNDVICQIESEYDAVRSLLCIVNNTIEDVRQAQLYRIMEGINPDLSSEN